MLATFITSQAMVMTDLAILITHQAMVITDQAVQKRKVAFWER